MSTSLAPPEPRGIAVGGLRQARRHKRDYDAVITLEDPGCRGPDRLRFWRSPHPEHLVLDFEDVDWERRLARRAGAPVDRLRPLRRLAFLAASILLVAVLLGLA